MGEKKLAELVTFVPGINQSRAKEKFGDMEIIYYDQGSFDEDYRYFSETSQNKGKNYSYATEIALNEHDVVISNSSKLATLVSELSVGKVLPLNFTKVEFNTSQLDKYYFLYLFNEYKDVQRQKERELQGSGPILRLTRQSLEQLVIPIVPLEEQKKIGAIYIEALKVRNMLTKYTGLLEQFTGAILKKSMGD